MRKFVLGGAVFLAMSSAAAAQVLDDCRDCYVRQVTPQLFVDTPTDVVVRPGKRIVRRLPARYQTVYENVLVAPEQVVERIVPATIIMRQEQVLVAPARREWQYRRDASGRDVLCEVDIPAQYQTVNQPQEVTPAHSEYVTIPAQYRQRAHRILVEPARRVVTRTPAEVHTLPIRREFAPATERWVPTSNPDYQPVSATSGRL